MSTFYTIFAMQYLIPYFTNNGHAAECFIDFVGVDTALADIQYEGDDFYMGRVFKSKADCKIKLAIHAINRKFHFRTTRSSPSILLAQCVGDACPQRVYAVLLDASGNFQVRQANLVHSCTVDDRRNYHKLATTIVIGQILQSRFVGIKKGPTAAAIRKILLDEFHVNVSYWKAWRAREMGISKYFPLRLLLLIAKTTMLGNGFSRGYKLLLSIPRVQFSSLIAIQVSPQD